MKSATDGSGGIETDGGAGAAHYLENAREKLHRDGYGHHVLLPRRFVVFPVCSAGDIYSFRYS